VGHSVPRVDAWDKVTGAAEFTIDFRLPGMLFGKILRSPLPHARIVRIDASRAKALHGVEAVITGQEIPKTLYGIGLNDRPLLARDRVRFVGEAVAAVAATSLGIARKAISLIEVKYEPLPAVFDAEEAMAGKTIIHPDLDDYKRRAQRSPNDGKLPPNVSTTFKLERGNVEKGFEEADFIIENRYSTASMAHAAAEPHSSIAEMDKHGNLTVYAGTQTPFRLTIELSEALNIPAPKIRVVTRQLGGGFGGKAQMSVEGICALLAQETSRPVQIVLDRNEVFFGSCTNQAFTTYVKDGVMKDGRVVARQVKAILNGGAYTGSGYAVIRNSSFPMVLYRIENLRFESFGVYSNLPPAGPLRGFGSPQIAWAVEQQMDEIARRLGMNPVILRLKNIARDGDVSPFGVAMKGVTAEECLLAASKKIGLEEQYNHGSGRIRRGRGIALASKHFWSGASTALVRVNYDSTVEVFTSAIDMGQGLKTVLAQIAAEAFGISVGMVKVSDTDTGLTPYDAGIVGSRGTFNAGHAVRLACRDAKSQILREASKKLGVSEDALNIASGRVYSMTSDAETTIQDLFTKEPDSPLTPFLGEGAQFVGKATWYEREKSTLERLNFSYTAQAAEVEIDLDTGSVKVLRYVSAVEGGRPINPLMFEAQVRGGAVQGMGMALLEELLYSNGRTANANYIDYKLPSSLDAPNIEVIAIENDFPDGPYGAKGIGELVMVPVAPAIANAIFDATQTRFRSAPVTPSRLMEGLKGEK
jgi:CO/xanthine dehydrogenase Mo-binding subunit